MSTPETLTRELAALDDALAGRPVDPDLADLAELAVLVRDERPAVDPAFARSLDERAERGFPRAAKRRMPAFSWPKLTLPALGVAASVLLVVVIATSIPGGGTTDRRQRVVRRRRRLAPSESAGSGASSRRLRHARPEAGRAVGGDSAPRARRPLAARAPAARQPGRDGRSRRYVERSAQIVDRHAAARHRPRRRRRSSRWPTTSAASWSRPRSSSGSSGEFELRVPERRLQNALSRLSDVGKVRERTQASQDITGAVVSVQARLKDARTERRSLLQQLAKATTVNQTTSIRERLRLVSGQIAAAKRDLRSVKRARELLDDRGARCSPTSAPAPRPATTTAGRPATRSTTPRRILEVSAGVLLVAAALALPLGLVALLVWLAMRQAAQRRRERALDAV